MRLTSPSDVDVALNERRLAAGRLDVARHRFAAASRLSL